MSEAAWPSRRRAWAFIALLFLAGLFSVIDRAVLNVVVDPVRHDLAIGDEQIGLLQGLAFGLFYAFMGLPMGLLADRRSRRNLVAGGIALWSLATIASGLAQTFGQIFTARLLVGLGEAALSPAAISLIADLFPPDHRGRPLSVFMLGQSLANGLAIALTGLILAHAASGAFAGLPLVGSLAPWRLAFVLFGTVGLLVAALLLLCREPGRRGSERNATELPGKEELRFLIAHRGVLVPLYLGFSVCFAVVYGAAAWTPAMLSRQFAATPGFFASFHGPASLAFAAIGPLLGGWLLDQTMRAGKPLARFSVLALVPACAIPAQLAVLADNLPVAALLVASAGTAVAVLGIVMLATLQAIVPPTMRGAAVALTLVLNTVIGATLGPLAIASITERVIGDPAKVGWSIAVFGSVCLIVGIALYALARRNMTRDAELMKHLAG